MSPPTVSSTCLRALTKTPAVLLSASWPCLLESAVPPPRSFPQSDLFTGPQKSGQRQEPSDLGPHFGAHPVLPPLILNSN